MTSQIHFREIFDLYTKLFISLGGKNQSDLIQHVSQHISKSVNRKTVNDESTILGAIINHITTTKSESDANAFRLSYDRLVHCMEPESRSAIIAFLFFMADSKTSNVCSTDSNVSTTRTHNSEHSMSDRKHFFSNKLEASQTVPTASVQSSPQLYSSISDNQLKVCQRLSSSAISNNIGHSCSYSDIAVSQRKLTEELVQEVIYSFSGIQGKFLRKDIISGGFKLDAKATTLCSTEDGMLLRLSQLGHYHNQVQSYTDPKSGNGPLLGQGYVTALKNELTKYYGMVALLQEQVVDDYKKLYQEVSNE